MIQQKNTSLKQHFRALFYIAFFTFTLASCETEDPNFLGLLVPKTVDQELSLPSITVGGAKLHSEAFGKETDPIIFILHGGPGADYRYLLKCKAFASQGYRVVFYDQRGSGLSQRFPSSSYTSVNTFVDELGEVIKYYRKLPNQKVFLLGHSWGGMLATAYVNANPEAVDGLVIGEAGGFIWKDILDYVGRSRSISFSSETFNDFTYYDQFITGDKNQHEILDYKYALASAGDGRKDNPIGNEEMSSLPFWRYGSVVNTRLFELGSEEKPNWTTNLSKFTTKVLFIYSENNRAYGLDHAKKVSSAYPNVTLFKALGAGHDMLSFTTGWNNCYPEILTYFNSLK